MRWFSPVAVLVGAAILALLPSLGLPPYYISLLSQTFVLGIAAASLDLLVGQAGMVSFCHASFFGIGGYSVGILATRLHVQAFWTPMLVGILLAAVAAAIFGLVALRGEGVSFLMITLAVNQIIWGLAFQWVSVSGGENGLSGFFRPKLFGIDIGTNTRYYQVCLAFLLLAIGLIWLITNSPFGLVLKGIKERPRRLRALGYNVWVYQYLAFVVAAAFAGMSGVLWTYFNTFVSPADLALGQTVQILIMVILGGSGTLLGPVLGAAILIILSNTISAFTERWQTILGAIYVTVVMYAPEGTVGIGRRLLGPTKQRRGST